ncbi:hypothetical protein C8J57DRAFT_115792 [Mycena rebaudengoi]|nr:hypothetical protein C8J57DRAFT_115792 [Mycena rebaudengoi]
MNLRMFDVEARGRSLSLPALSSLTNYSGPQHMPETDPHLKSQQSSLTLDAQRDASRGRMFQVWAGLEKKYTLPIHEDDLINLDTGEVDQNRGVLEAQDSWKFPRFADVDDPPNLMESRSMSTSRLPRVLESVADAWDLRNFHQAERRRKRECGEEDSGDETPTEDMDLHGHKNRRISDSISKKSPKFLKKNTAHHEEIEESDDELISWGVADETSIVYPVGTQDKLPSSSYPVETNSGRHLAPKNLGLSVHKPKQIQKSGRRGHQSPRH